MGGAAGMVVIFFMLKKWKDLRRIDTAAMPQAILKTRKYSLLTGRWERKAQGLMGLAKKNITPFVKNFFIKIETLHKKLNDWELRYRHMALKRPRSKKDKEIYRQKINTLLVDGDKFIGEGRFAEAENLLIEAVRLNPKEVEAYLKLGEVYLQKKEYDHALESLEFAKKLQPKNERIYCDLGLIYNEQQDLPQALAHFQQCVKLSPNNPRNLDNLLTLAITMKKKLLAENTLVQLKKVNPENQKLTELEVQIKEL